MVFLLWALCVVHYAVNELGAPLNHEDGDGIKCILAK